MTAPGQGPGGLPQLLTYEEAAQALRISVRTLARWVAAEQVPVRRFGSRVFFTVDDVRAITDASLQPARPAQQRQQRRQRSVQKGRLGLAKVEAHRAATSSTSSTSRTA